MKRFHVTVAILNLARSIQFYSALFDSEPTVQKPDYAKWMLDDPRVNFAISQHGAPPGIEHLGIQSETEAQLKEVYARLKNAGHPVIEKKATTCYYANSDKQWKPIRPVSQKDLFHPRRSYGQWRRSRRRSGHQPNGLLRARMEDAPVRRSKS